MKNAIFLITLAVLVTGCTGSPDVSDLLGYPGVSITEFYSLSSTVMEGGEIDLLLQVQNTGHFDAVDVDVMLFGCGTSEESDGATWVCDEYSDLEAKLSKPDLELNVPGEIAEKQFRLTAPDNIIGGKVSHTFLSRVRYDYSTSAGADVVLSSFENWKASNQQIDVGALNSYSTDAPMSIEINVPSKPVILPADSNEDKFITVVVTVRNSANGIIEGGKLNEISLYFNPEFLTPMPMMGTMFLSDELYTGDLGGLAGADRVCQQDAEETGLGGAWIAMLSDENVNLGDRVPSGPYYNIRGELAYDGSSNLFDASLNGADYAYTADGSRVPSETRFKSWGSTCSGKWMVTSEGWVDVCAEWNDDETTCNDPPPIESSEGWSEIKYCTWDDGYYEAEPEFWSGTKRDGTYSKFETINYGCNSWTSNSPNENGVYGKSRTTSSISSIFSDSFMASCDSEYRILCMNGDRSGFHRMESVHYEGIGDTLFVDTPDVLNLLGLASQWKTYKARFKIKNLQGLIQEVISFSAEADYTYIEEGQATVVIEE
ncbi:TPA: hypothetical protein H1008_02570 [archaeon]|nr:hypothetical protein [Candidatus Undinarchaeales archaeon SRR5007147.bin71]